MVEAEKLFSRIRSRYDKPGRMHYIDNLRVVLTIIVVMHHAAVTYGGSGGWYYKEGRQDTLTAVLLGWFSAVNQAYFMSLFFMLSGFFSAQSLKSKGARRFIKDRLLRLGVPLLIYDLAINPLIEYWHFVKFENYHAGAAHFLLAYFQHFPGFGRGPLWFIETLLIFEIAFVLSRSFTRNRADISRAASVFPRNGAIFLFALATGALAFIIRLIMPTGHSIDFLNLQVPYFSLYIALYTVGIAAYGRGWLHNIPDSAARVWLWVAAISILIFPLVVILGGALKGNLTPFTGGFHWQAALYAFWEPFVCMGMCVGLPALFRNRFNRRGAVGKAMAENAYTVYIIHGPILVAVSYTLLDLNVYPLLKFAIAAVTAVTSCFLMSHFFVRRIPGAKKIL